MDLVHVATCSIHWAILWSTESIKIRQNQEKDFGGVGVVWVEEIKFSVNISILYRNKKKTVNREFFYI